MNPTLYSKYKEQFQGKYLKFIIIIEVVSVPVLEM